MTSFVCFVYMFETLLISIIIEVPGFEKEGYLFASDCPYMNLKQWLCSQEQI